MYFCRELNGDSFKKKSSQTDKKSRRYLRNTETIILYGAPVNCTKKCNPMELDDLLHIVSKLTTEHIEWSLNTSLKVHDSAVFMLNNLNINILSVFG
jgi:hypothetical protein